MSKNQVFIPGDRVSLPVPERVVSGQPLRVGVLNGVAVTDRGAGGNTESNASVALEGVFRVQVKGAVNSVGKEIYFESNELNATGSTVWGVALETQTGNGNILVRIKN